MSETMKNKMKIAITVAIVGLFIWFLIVSPMITFHKNEKEVERAAKRYFDSSRKKISSLREKSPSELLKLTSN